MTGEDVFTMKDLGPSFTFTAQTTKGPQPTKYEVTLKCTGKKSSASPALFQVYNSIFKRVPLLHDWDVSLFHCISARRTDDMRADFRLMATVTKVDAPDRAKAVQENLHPGISHQIWRKC